MIIFFPQYQLTMLILVFFLPPGAYEIESLNNETELNIFNEGRFTEEIYPFVIKPIFSTLGSILGTKANFNGTQISFAHDDSIRDLIGFDSRAKYEKCNLTQIPVDFLPFDNMFLKCDIAQGMIFRGNENGINPIFTMDVDPGYKYIEKSKGGFQWYMMETKHFVSSIRFKLKIENGNLVSFNGQIINFRLSIK